jgi:AAA domain/DnaB-like helicase N terminal domain
MTNDRLREAESAVVGDCIMSPHTVRNIAAIISPGDFEDLRLGQVFGLIAAMISSGGAESVTGLTVGEEIARRAADSTQQDRKRHAVWPDPGLVAAMITNPHSGRTEAHAQLIREAAIGREAAAVCRRHLTAIETGEDPMAVVLRLVESAKAVRDSSQKCGLDVRLLADIFADEDPGYDWLIPGLLERRDRLVYTGAEGAGKSTFGRQVALCGAAGIHPFKRERFKPIRVTVIDNENSEQQWRRKARGIALAVKAITHVDPAMSVHLSTPGRLDITKPDGLGAIHSVLDEYPTDLLLIGPLYKLVPFAITNDDHAAPILAALDSLRERDDGPALMIEAHAGHALGKGGERDFRPRGSAALLGWPEFGFGFAPDLEDPDRINVVRWRGDRDERDWPQALVRGGTLPWTSAAFEVGSDREPHRDPYPQHHADQLGAA